MGRSGEITGWLWEAAAAALIRETIPTSLMPIFGGRAYLNATRHGRQHGRHPDRCPPAGDDARILPRPD